ncbi:hypothetical protein HYPDE_26028 [Hyphomicrobium denitrificans 1NES1]|uniref:Glycosyltransferase RgtA/B/C/D-like domain-containing protein n=1 Tax=Hyphomicrobium denitrificans 1NES1 TaxID=670307 RepID=N0B1R1_9HYPH|nr:hypothetical protein [Hyphomicrobium denitrificans]AGK56888.1 hypothetical protein HYPDE_26028 [Hyphomicrobium denitrificans 1NES1]
MTGKFENLQTSKVPFESIRKLVAFLAVGGTFAIAYSLLCTLLVKALPGHSLIISIGVHAFLIPFAFFAQRVVTFASSGVMPQEFFRYAGLQIASISLSAFLLSRLVGQNDIINLFVFLSISAISAIVSFAVCSFYIFRTRDPDPTSSLRSAATDGIRSRVGNSQPISPVIAVMLFAAVLLIPAIENGFPFVFSDTGVYLRAAVERFIPWERSVFYSIFGIIFHLQVSPWPVIAAQALIVAVLIRIFAIKILSVRSEAALIITAMLLSFASSLPWFAGELMPDIFTGALFMASLIIGFAWDRLANWERAFAFAVVSGSVAFHYGNVLIALGALLVFAVLWVVGWQPIGRVGARIRALAAAISLGTLVVVSTNSLMLGTVAVSPASSIFMLAKLLRDGPAFAILEQNCPASGWALCTELGDLENYRDREKRETSLPSIADYFLWGGPLERLGWWKTFEPEAALVVRKALLVSPLSLLKESAKDFFRQLMRFSIGDALLPYGDGGEPVDSIRAVFGKEAVSEYLASSQARQELPLKAINILQTSLVLGSLCFLACGCIYTRQRDSTVLHLTLALCGFVLVNAAVTATFSSVHDRYQSRVIWLIPMLASLVVARWLKPTAMPERSLGHTDRSFKG